MGKGIPIRAKICPKSLGHLQGRLAEDVRKMKYCPSCGTKLEIRKCKFCGKELDFDFVYCVYCGKGDPVRVQRRMLERMDEPGIGVAFKDQAGGTY